MLAKVGTHRTQREIRSNVRQGMIDTSLKRKLCSNLRQGRIDTGTCVVQREVGKHQIRALTQKRNRQIAICVLVLQCNPRTAIWYTCFSSILCVCVCVCIHAQDTKVYVLYIHTTTGGTGGETPPTSSGITGTCWPTASCKISLCQHAL